MLRSASTRLIPALREVGHAARYATAATATAPTTEPQTALAEKLLRRFWKTVAIEETSDGQYGIKLDKRNLRTPGGKVVVIPRERLPVALLIAEEWENQVAVLKPHTLPMTSIWSRAIDGLAEPADRKAVAAGMIKYLDTDTVCFHEEHPPALVALQDGNWKPLIAWVEEKFGVKVKVYDGILGTRQESETIEKLSAAVAQFDAFKLAAFERAVLASKSYLIALGLVEGFFSTDEAAKAAHVEVQSQIDRWGEVEDSQSRFYYALPSMITELARVAHDVDHQDVRVRLGSAALLTRTLSSS